VTPGGPTPKNSVTADPDSDRPFALVRTILPAIAVAASLVFAFAGWKSHLRKRNVTLAAELGSVQARWARVSAHLEEDAAERARLETFLKTPERITEERRAPRWTPALRCLATVARTDLENVEIEVQGDVQQPGKCTLRIRGHAIGSTPHAAAETYRKSVQKGLETVFAQVVTVRFDELDVRRIEGEEISAEGPLGFTMSAVIDQPDAIAHAVPSGS
jgi:hypothetical protein